MPKPNYRFDKRQREMKKAKEQEEKRLKKLARGNAGSDDQAPDAPPPAESDPETPGG